MKDMKRKALAAALSIAAGGALAQQAQKVEKIEVTGSNIKRVDTETAAPVQIITREEIERSGRPRSRSCSRTCAEPHPAA